MTALTTPIAPIPIYVRTRPVARLGLGARLLAGAVSCVCFGVLGLAAWLTPDASGMGTHRQLGLSPCGMVELFGIPCPTCGYTTSFSLFAHGRWGASFWNQPAGFVAAMVCAVISWGLLYVAVTGSQVHRLMVRWVTGRLIFGCALFAIAGWAWKIAMFKLAH